MTLSTGLLELNLITASPAHYLVLKLNDVEIVLTPESRLFKKGDSGLLMPWTELPGSMLLFDLSGCPAAAIDSLDTYLVDFTSMPAPEVTLRNQLALVDEHGQIVGEIECDNAQDLARPKLDRTDSSKEPVIVDIDETNGSLSVEKFKDSKIVKSGTFVSSGILYGADVLSNSMQKTSAWLNSKSPPAEKDIEFSSVTKAGTRRIHQLSTGVAHVSAKTIGYVASLAEAAGGKVAGHKKEKHDAKPPGYLSQSAHAIVTILEAFDQGGKQVLGSASDSVGSVVQHRYGSQAGLIANQLGGSVKNVALVYFDTTGVSHRALLKAGIKGGVKARMSDGRHVVLDDSQIKKQA